MRFCLQPTPGLSQTFMTRDPFKRRKIKLVIGVLAVGIVISALLALALIYLARKHPGS